MKHIALAFLLAVPAPALALTSFSETTDFPRSSTGPAFGFVAGTLAAGENSIFGGLDGACVPGDCNPPVGAGDTQDSFVIELPAGPQIDTISISSLGSGPNDFFYSFSYRDGAGNFDFPSALLPVNDSSGNLLTSPLIKTVEFSDFGQTASTAGPYTVNYQITLDVSETMAAVPLPAGGFSALARLARFVPAGASP